MNYTLRPFLQARWCTHTSGRTIRLLVLHVMVAPEKDGTAESVASAFHTWDRKASAHECIDNNSVVPCVHDQDVAYAAVSANSDGKHYEMAGYVEQTPGEWRDPYSDAMLQIVAVRVAADCVKYGIPPRRLSLNEIADKRTKGITHHADIEKVWPSTGHTDVGPNFPWDYFIALVQKEVARLTNHTPPMEDDDMDRTCIPSWVKRQTNGSMPFLKVDQAPDVAPNAVRVLAAPGIPFKSGIDKAPGGLFTLTSSFGIPTLVVRPPDGIQIVGIEEHASSGAILLCQSDMHALDIAVKP